MGKFNLDNYETVKQRKKRYYGDYPDARIIVQSISENPTDYAMMIATIYSTAEDQEKGLARATGHAFEWRDKELSTSSRGNQYESVNYTSWTENCEESAIGRALDNAGYASDPSQEEMAKVERNAEKTPGKNSKPSPKEPMRNGKPETLENAAERTKKHVHGLYDKEQLPEDKRDQFLKEADEALSIGSWDYMSDVWRRSNKAAEEYVKSQAAEFDDAAEKAFDDKAEQHHDEQQQERGAAEAKLPDSEPVTDEEVKEATNDDGELF